MKKLILITAILLTSIISNATSIHPDTFLKVSELKHFELDKQIFSTEYINSGTLEINPVTKKAVLNLIEISPICPPPKPGFMTCMAVGNRYQEITIELPLIDTKKGFCGATIYIAQKDSRPSDGNLETLEVVDNSTMICEIAIPEDRMTTLTYTVETAGFGGPIQIFESKASGTILKSPLLK